MKLIDVFDKIADKTIEDNFEFSFKGYDWIWDGENIRTKEKDYYDSDYLCYRFIDEVMELSDLSEDIDVIICKFTTNNDDMIEDGLFSGLVKNDNVDTGAYVRDGYCQVLPTFQNISLKSTSPYRCPICNGTGHVSSGFYQSTGQTWISTGGFETCRSCCGKGIIWK